MGIDPRVPSTLGKRPHSDSRQLFSVIHLLSALQSCTSHKPILDTASVPSCRFRSCPRRRSGPREGPCPRPTPRSPARRSPAPVRTSPATRSRRLPCLQPAPGRWRRLRLPLKSPSTGIPAGPRTRRAPRTGTALRSANASCPTTPPSGMWRKFMSSSDHCQVGETPTEEMRVMQHLWLMTFFKTLF